MKFHWNQLQTLKRNVCQLGNTWPPPPRIHFLVRFVTSLQWILMKLRRLTKFGVINSAMEVNFVDLKNTKNCWYCVTSVLEYKFFHWMELSIDSNLHRFIPCRRNHPQVRRRRGRPRSVQSISTDYSGPELPDSITRAWLLSSQVFCSQRSILLQFILQH